MKKIISVLFAVTLLAMYSCLAIRATDESRETEHDANESSSMFQSMLDYAANNDYDIFDTSTTPGQYQLDTSAFYDMLKDIDDTKFNALQWEVPTADGNIAALNLKYELLQNDIKHLSYGEQYELSMPQLNNGYSQNITDLFSSEFGDLSYKFEYHSLPEGIDMRTIMQNIIANRDEMLDGLNISAAFDSIKDNHSIGDVFGAAQQVLNSDRKPTVNSADLITNIDIFAAGMQKNWGKNISENFAAIEELYGNNLAQIGGGFTISDEAAQAFDNLVSDNQKNFLELDIDKVIQSAGEVKDEFKDIN